MHSRTSRILLVFTTLLCAFASGARAEESAARWFRELDRHFRASQRHVPAPELFSEAQRRLGSKALKELAALSQAELLTRLTEAQKQDPSLDVNQGVAENWLKLRRLAERARELKPMSLNDDRVMGLGETALKRLIEGFPPSDPARTKPNEFDYRERELMGAAKRNILDNDLYNFKVAATYWSKGLHQTHRASFSLFSRGKKNRPYLIAAGQELAIDMLQNLRFTEREIQYLKNHPDFNDVPPAFFDYLRSFKFRGTVRAVKTGTVLFKDQPILEVTGNPVEAQIVETLLLPLINAVSTSATKASRVVHAANGRPVFEGGTRRGFNGLLSSLGAWIGGVASTSNAHAGRLFGIPSAGTMNHALVETFDTELESFANHRKMFPTTSFLVDNYDIENGVRNAVLAAGKTLKGVRLDSTIPDKTKAETARVVRDLLDSLGYHHVPVTYSDGLDEYELDRMKDAPFQMTLVGTEIAAPSDGGGLNVVYKLVENEGHPDPIKLASGKAGVPGRKQIFRFLENGKMKRDLVAELGEKTPEGAIPLLETVMENGQRVGARPTADEQRSHASAGLASIPPALREVHREVTAENAFPVETSERLRNRQAAALLAHQESTKERVGVMPFSVDPVTEGHLLLARRAKILGKLKKVIFIPGADQAVHGKHYLFNGKQRAAMLRQNLLAAGWHPDEFEIDTTEVDSGQPRFFIDTLKDLERQGKTKDKEIFVIAGADLAGTLGRWKEAETLVNDYNWIVAKRRGHASSEAETSPFPAAVTRQHRFIAGGHLVSPSGKLLLSAELNLPEVSSTRVRERIKKVDTVFYQVGSGGSDALTANARRLSGLARGSDRIKSISTVSQPETSSEARTLFVPVDASFELDAHAADLRDPEVELLVQKADQGLASPRLSDIYSRVGPRHVVVYGNASGACVECAVRELKDKGYDVAVVTDATAGLDPTKAAGCEKLGARLVTTDEVVRGYGSGNPCPWPKVGAP